MVTSTETVNPENFTLNKTHTNKTKSYFEQM